MTEISMRKVVKVVLLVVGIIFGIILIGLVVVNIAPRHGSMVIVAVNSSGESDSS
jgi:ABC-type microcin C transport system permease subunit YejB